MTLPCVICGKHVALRVDLDDLDRHLRHGVFVQDAFVGRDGRPYLSAGERELFLSGCCEGCWSLLCSPNPLDYD